MGELRRLWAHMRSLWPRYTLLPPAPFVAWAVFWLLFGGLRWDHVVLALIPLVLSYWNQATKKLYLGLLPMGLVALFYDGMRFVKNTGLTESNVHVCDLQAAEKAWFGITVDGVRMTLQDWFQAHSSVALDLFCAIPYGTFIFAVVGYAVFLYIRDFSAQQRFTWAFLLLNIAGFLTYHIYPAAPPWYVHTHGCTVDLSAAASEGPNLARVDAMLGMSYFRGFYGRASDVYGAVPSLHVTYPLLIAIEGWRHHKAFGRTLLTAFYLSMCFSAVYLDHHWVIDIVVGTLYGIAAAVLMRRVWSYAPAMTGAPVLAPAAEESGREVST